jgi:hypothetical protein
VQLGLGAVRGGEVVLGPARPFRHPLVLLVRDRFGSSGDGRLPCSAAVGCLVRRGDGCPYEAAGQNADREQGCGGGGWSFPHAVLRRSGTGELGRGHSLRRPALHRLDKPVCHLVTVSLSDRHCKWPGGPTPRAPS